jgi:hypothetical protein
VAGHTDRAGEPDPTELGLDLDGPLELGVEVDYWPNQYSRGKF